MNQFIYAIVCATFLLVAGDQILADDPQVLPLSDPDNVGGWILNTDVSDEFDGTEVDEDRWYIVGKFRDGKPFYKHPDKPDHKVWKGRPPAQFSGRNYRLEDDIIPEIRVGIALGEVIITNDTITGAGVVLAQRLEQVAPPGAICIICSDSRGGPR